MKVKISEAYPGEFNEKREELKKALFPSAKGSTRIKIPKRKMRSKAHREIIDRLEDEYKKTLEDIFDEIEMKFAEWFGK